MRSLWCDSLSTCRATNIILENLIVIYFLFHALPSSLSTFVYYCFLCPRYTRNGSPVFSAIAQKQSQGCPEVHLLRLCRALSALTSACWILGAAGIKSSKFKVFSWNFSSITIPSICVKLSLYLFIPEIGYWFLYRNLYHFLKYCSDYEFDAVLQCWKFPIVWFHTIGCQYDSQIQFFYIFS